MPTERNHSYLQSTQDATPTLQTFVKQIIQNHGAITFAEYMQHALYHPELGYYNRGAEIVGKKGDFFTSVSVGKTFGLILAHRIHSYWESCDSPTEFHLVEMGANTGQLANDILDTLNASFPELYLATHYHIVEHLDSMKASQRETLSQHTEKLTHHSELSDISLPDDSSGIALSNELIDAFPVHLIKKENGSWKEKYVTLHHDAGSPFAWENRKISSPELEAFTTTLSPDLPEGYETEYRPHLTSYTDQLKQLFTTGLIITIDYGYTHSSFYHPSRTTGTLRCYHRHKADEDPLVMIGEKDITAHVDFTQLAKSFQQSGFHITDFQSQSSYFTNHAKPWLLELERNPPSDMMQLIRQFQTLTHPTTMGSQFLVLEAQTQPPESRNALQMIELS